MNSPKKIPVLVCEDRLSGKVHNVDIGENFCKRSYLFHYLGVRSKWNPTFKCGNAYNIHYCAEVDTEKAEFLRGAYPSGYEEWKKSGKYPH